EERDDRAKVLAILLSILLGLGILLVLIDFFIIPPINLLRSQIRFGLMVAISLPLLILLRRGYIDTVAYGFIIALWAFSTYLAATGGGIYATAVQTFLLITFLAILIGGRRFAVWIGILSVFTEVCLAVFQSQIPTLTNRNPLSQLIVNIVYLVAIILVQDYSVRSLRRAMRKTIEAEKERQQAKTTLIESQERFKAIFDQAEIGVVLSDLEGRFIEANQAFCQFVGYTISELQKLGFPELTRESDLKLEFEFLHDVMTGSRRSYTLEKQYIRRDGTLIPVNLTVSLLRDLNNEPKAYLGIIQDISEKYSAEIALKLSEERFKIMFENAGVGMAQIGPAGHFVACNHAYTEIMGYTEAEILQHSFQDFMRPEDLPISDQGYKDLLTGTIDRYSTERQYIH
ncbi:MAG: PAS domain S-box protein, partial [Leptonema sp. (in: Bacteria)]|nr:PAS domain S-box protein [Leptonema sp. (in: bacteria)]